MSTKTKQPSLKELISNTISDGKKLLTAQVNLTTTEIQQTGKTIGAISVLAIVALSLLSLGGLFLLIALAYVLVAVGLPIWAGFLIVAGVLVLIAGILGAVAYRKSQSIEGPSVATKEWQKTSESIAQITNRPV
ncbi:MAG: phage holin family protein [Candidatus Nanopelagicales bacterium]|jgi:hypothetical protein